jgi:hypothetical protein
MNVQEIIVGIVVLASFVWLVRRIVQYINRIKRNETPCTGCGCAGCPSAKGCGCEKNA